MAALGPDACRDRLVAADHGVLATADREGRPHAVPVCFVVIDHHVAIPVDDVKAKSSSALRRFRNLAATGRAALLVEQWDADDWSRLWWVRADLVADVDGAAPPPGPDVTEPTLRGKYRQYRHASFADVVVARIDRFAGWAAD